MKKVMAFGTFDILHPGHEFFLQEAKKLGDNLTVLIARDRTVKNLKKHHPKHGEEVRLKNLEALALADRVILGVEGGDKYAMIRETEPDIIALGYDQVFFIENLKKNFPNISIVRIGSFRPDIYHSSIIGDKSII